MFRKCFLIWRTSKNFDHFFLLLLFRPAFRFVDHFTSRYVLEVPLIHPSLSLSFFSAICQLHNAAPQPRFKSSQRMINKSFHIYINNNNNNNGKVNIKFIDIFETFVLSRSVLVVGDPPNRIKDNLATRILILLM